VTAASVVEHVARPPATPWLPTAPLADEAFARIRRRAIFDCCKWDPQVEDVSTLAAFPLVLQRETWRELVVLAEALAAETLAAERELLGRPELHGRLGLPRAVRRALAGASRQSTLGTARLIRFDFHHTPGGWRISEANTDVPGGINEGSGLPRLFEPFHARAESVGDPAGAYARALVDSAGGATVALVHATAYSDDRQVMTYLGRRIEALGGRPALVSPAHLRWRDRRASIDAAWGTEAVGAIARFFPAEWLPNLPACCGWPRFFAGGATAVSNPAAAVMTQSKRFPLVWDALETALPTWRALLPETRDPREGSAWRSADDWVIKPALGRVGEGIGLRGVTAAKDWRALERAAARHPELWVAQRRFEPTCLHVGAERLYPCVGVFTVGTRVAGAYGRLARRAIIDWRAQDVAVLAATDETEATKAS
jgi:Glutathionylspermidine synthase preATP-grasp